MDFSLEHTTDVSLECIAVDFLKAGAKYCSATRYLDHFWALGAL